MKPICFLYYASNSFQSRAKVLHESIKQFHPDSDIVSCNPDSLSNHKVGEYIPGMAKQRLRSALSILESGEDVVCVLGADCVLYHRMDKVLNRIHNYDAMIVPHMVTPIPDTKFMAEVYTVGSANADMMVFKNTENGKNILKWLISVTEGHDKEKGIFYEQTWLSQIPYIFDNVHILRDPEYNVGYWDLAYRNLNIRNGKFFIDSTPLVMAQFSGYVKGLPHLGSKYCSKLFLGDNLKLFKDYDDRITE